MRGLPVLAFTLALLSSGCRKEEQAVVGVAQNAVTAEQKAQQAAQTAAAERDHQREQLERIPLPTKSLYVNVKDPNAWANPYLSVEAGSIVLRTTDGTVDRQGDKPGDKSGTHRQQTQVAPANLIASLIALPPTAWRYGRVVAIAESTQAAPKDRPAVRRNVEAAIKQLNELGIVFEEWPIK
jgi:type II secretory pathway pseudopilin PulG